MRRKQIAFVRSITVIFALVILIVLCGCGRNEGKTIVQSEAENDHESLMTTANDSSVLPVSTGDAIKQKKLKQFIKAGADTKVMADSDIKNILIIGQDRRESHKSEMRSDCMMIFSINTITNEINLVSFMRDMYIPCADGKDGMINLTYLNGGAELLSQTIEMNFGIHIDNYIETDFWRFMDLFNSIGDIELELSAGEADAVNAAFAPAHIEYYNEKLTQPSCFLTSGINYLGPEQLLDYCRVRQNIGGDWARTERQRKTIIATYNKLNDMSYAGLIRLIKDSAHYLSTDMDVADMLGYYYWLKKNGITQINGYRLPLEGTYTQEIREGSLNVLVPQIEPNKNAIQQYIYGNAS